MVPSLDTSSVKHSCPVVVGTADSCIKNELLFDMICRHTLLLSPVLQHKETMNLFKGELQVYKGQGTKDCRSICTIFCSYVLCGTVLIL